MSWSCGLVDNNSIAQPEIFSIILKDKFFYQILSVYLLIVHALLQNVFYGLYLHAEYKSVKKLKKIKIIH